MLRRLGTALVAGLIVCGVAPAGATAAITVANTNDTGPGSLRQAIAEAPPGETIVVPAGTYTLKSGELTIKGSLTIAGAGAAETILRSGGPFRVVSVTGAKTQVKIAGVTIRDGEVEEPGGIAQGGGVLDEEASLTLEGVVVTNNVAEADGAPGKPGGLAEGGGIFSEGGALTLVASTVSANHANADGGVKGPGGIGEGGGLFVEGELQVSSTSFSGNTAEALGGQGPTEGKQPGGIAKGGGVYAEIEGSSASLSGLAVSANTATAAAAAGEAGGIAKGGGLFVETEIPVSIGGSTVSGNAALAPSGDSKGSAGIADGGGVFFITEASATLTNATIAANTAIATPGTGGIANGGGLLAEPGIEPMAITNSTLDANKAESQSGHGGDLNPGGPVRLLNSIVANGQGPAGSENCSSSVESLGHNIDGRDQCGFHAGGDQVNKDPLLGPLQANGGPVQTEALGAGSPAIDGGTNAGCPSTDARGVARPQGAACDVGAFELAPPSASTGAATGVGATVATLQGLAGNPAVLPGSFVFQLGTTTSYGLQVAPLAPVLPVGASGQALSAPAGGLAPGTPYHFRAVASNSDGSAAGGDQTFTTAPLPPVGSVPPVLSRLVVSPSSLRAVPGRGASIAAAKRGGATVSYSDSQAARTTLTVLAARKGFRVGRTCRATRPRHGVVRRCTRYVALGTFAHSDVAGANRFRFTGRVRGKGLAAGRYRLSAVARGASGQASRPLTASFQVIR